MKFMLFAATALAATQVKRQLSVVNDALAAVSSGTTELDNGIKAFTPGDTDAIVNLQTIADNLVTTINNGNSQVEAIAVLGNDAAGLAIPVTALGKLVQATVADLKAKKDDLVSAGVGGIVYDKAVALQSAATTFTNTILSKVPATLQTLGASLAKPISDALNDAVSSFADQQTPGGGSSPSSGAPSATTGGSTAPSTTGGSTAPTSSAPTPSSNGTQPYPTSSKPAATPTFTGAAVANAAGFGAVVMAVFAGAAML